MRAAERGVALHGLRVAVDSESDDRGILGIAENVPAGPLSMRLRVSGGPRRSGRVAAARGHRVGLRSLPGLRCDPAVGAGSTHNRVPGPPPCYPAPTGAFGAVSCGCRVGLARRREPREERAARDTKCPSVRRSVQGLGGGSFRGLDDQVDAEEVQVGVLQVGQPTAVLGDQRIVPRVDQWRLVEPGRAALGCSPYSARARAMPAALASVCDASSA